MSKKLTSILLCSVLAVGNLTPITKSYAATEIDVSMQEKMAYQRFIEDDHVKDFDELIQEGALVKNEYDYLNELKKYNNYSLFSQGFSAEDIFNIKSFSDENFAQELSQLSYDDLMDRGLTINEISDLKNGVYNEEMLRSASSNIAFKFYKNWTNITGTHQKGTFKSAMTLEYAFDNHMVSSAGSGIMAFAWGYPCVTDGQSTAKVTYVPRTGTSNPGSPLTIRLSKMDTNNPNYGGYFSYDYKKHNNGSTYAGKGKAYVVIKNSEQGYRGVMACGSVGVSTNSPWSVSLTVGPASISYTGENTQLAIGNDRLS